MYLLRFRIKIFVINRTRRVYSLNVIAKEKREIKERCAQTHRESLRRGGAGRGGSPARARKNDMSEWHVEPL